MQAKEAADTLRPTFHLEQMPAEDRHHVKFIEDVAAELGVEPTPFNLHQVGQALDSADIHHDSNEFPKMLYSREAHGELPSTYDKRNDFHWIHVNNEEEAKGAGEGWVENLSDLPERAPVVEQ